MAERHPSHSASAPVVLLGALRSGTTVFRLMLDHHPDLHNPGETDFLLDHLVRDDRQPSGWRMDHASLKADRIFRAMGEVDLPDKEDGLAVLNALVSELATRAPSRRLVLVFHRHAEKIKSLFPSSPILHLLRDPRDVARSSVGMGWSGNSLYGLSHWIATEQGWDAAQIPPDVVHHLTFEALMTDVENELEQVCRFLGLSYSPEMLSYSETTTYAAPDPRIVRSWERKASVREIARLEAQAGPLLMARGYLPSQPPYRFGLLERVWLAVENRLKRWRFNIRRYGVFLFLGHHLARLFRLRKMTRHLAKRQEEIWIGKLK